MKLTISEAARRAGIKRPTLYRQLEKGLLTKEIDESGNPVIDLAELARLYPKAVNAPEQPGQSAPVQNSPNGHFDTARTAVLQRENELLRELVDGLKQDKQRLTGDLDRERDERDKLLAMLERERTLALPAPAPEPSPKEAPRSWSLWPWGRKTPAAADA